ncbi:MFS family permease [Microvirga flocculans]|uniref:MFS family permease n=1 Tax=Microvirga flocculans TaxID=217168 RepID=A0A7W6N8I2_9HYPH|nr:MFS transporter [Microvirga flocculans]MBB4040455.1 MFS family permease [Microvirga flocculans]
MTQEIVLASNRRIASAGAVIATAMMFGLTYSLSAALIALDLSERGFEESMIGLNAAMHAIGVLTIAPLLPRLVGLWGARPLVISALGSAAIVLVLFPAVPFVWLWFPLRFLLGMASEILFVLSETWINFLSTERIRARAMAVYTASLSLGFALGPLILSWTGTADATPYYIGAGLAALALCVIALPIVVTPAREAHGMGNPIRYARLAPVAIATTILNAAVETAGLSFLALYAMGNGWAEESAARLIATMMFGAILLQLPIGWLGDKMDRRRLVLILGMLAACGALIWPFVLQTPWLAHATVFFWGGLFVGIYTIMLTVVGSRFKGGELVGIYAVMGLTWGAGALLGPALAGLAMDVSAHGLPLFVSLACLVFVLFALRLKSET